MIFTLSGSVTIIGNRAFYECNSLFSVTLPDSDDWLNFEN